MTAILTEDFNRVVADQWTGGSFTWTLSGGTVPGDYDINGTKGLQTHADTNVLRHSYASTGTPNHKVRTTVNLSAADVTGAAATVFVLARMTNTSNYYAITLSYSTAEVVTMTLHKRVSGTLTAIGSGVTIATITGAANLPVTAELYVEGSKLYAKGWLASDPEPEDWQLEATDTSLTTGDLAGIASRRETSNTNAGLQFAYDSFTASSVGITAVEQDTYPPRVLVSVTDLNLGDSIQLYRVVGGERTLVRAGEDDSVSDPAFLRVDAELPFGVPVTYTALVNDEHEFSVGPTTYTLPGGKVALSDAISGSSAEAVIRAWPEKNYYRQASRFKVGGRNVVVLGDLGMFEGEIELYVETTSSRDNLFALLESATQGIVQLRQMGGYDGVDSYVAVIGVGERRYSQDGSDQRRTFVLDVSEVESWAPALEATGYTLQDIADAYDGLTLNDLAGDFDTLLDIAQGDFSA